MVFWPPKRRQNSSFSGSARTVFYVEGDKKRARSPPPTQLEQAPPTRTLRESELKRLAKMVAARVAVSIEELHSSLAACYETINNRPTTGCSQQEVLLLLQDNCFFPVVEQIWREIELLEGRSLKGHEQEQLVDFIRSRGYLLPEGVTPEALRDFAFKRVLLYNLLIDIQTCRLLAKKRLTTRLSFPSAALLGGVRTPEADAAERAQASLEAVKAIARAAEVPADSCASLHEAVQKGVLPQASQKLRGRAVEPSSQALVPALPAEALPDGALLKDIATITKVLDRGYQLRRRVMLGRLDVTIQAFLWSKKAAENEAAIATLLQGMMGWREALLNKHVNVYDVFAVDKSLLTSRLSLPISRTADPSKAVLPIKTLIIGPVPDRGGIPEGYTMQQIRSDVRRANESMRQRDSDRRPAFSGRGRGGGHWRGGGHRSDFTSRDQFSFSQSSSGSRGRGYEATANAAKGSFEKRGRDARSAPSRGGDDRQFRSFQNQPGRGRGVGGRGGGGFGGRVADRPATWSSAR
ncbi:hypothetical protein BESB_011250 [Besnoitia besnoiti]|uniref:Uncharacterized protein n=1 Tax=Besnoitia besnoiti TaxID=94643 RepID=A0A2A9MQV7_BESBE|nr:hypothetical protein BESB_011250 [Besnoitia besnoiti]PFH38783.1 hypothetical protein BESB_011250 [Besnoitia besnoiti]